METSRSTATRKPWLPLGYKVVLVSDVVVPTPPRPRSLKPVLLKPLQGKPSYVPMIAIATGGLFVLILAAAVYSFFQASVEGGRPGVVARGNIPQDFQVAIPAAIVNVQAADEKAEDPIPEDPGPKFEPGAAIGRENFGTEVQFARNPQEAGRLAREERKLTFLLHVSGNFENRAFT